MKTFAVCFVFTYFILTLYAQRQISTCETSIEVVYDTTGKQIVSGYWTCPDTFIAITHSDTSALHYMIMASIIQPHIFYNNGYKQVWFYYHYTDFFNIQHTDSVRIDFYQKPSCYSRIDTVMCGKAFTVDMYEWSGTNFSGMWTALPGNPGHHNFTHPNNPQTTIIVTHYGAYYFIWTEYNSLNPSCYCNDTLVINFVSVPLPSIETDFMTVCNSRFACFCVNATGPGSWSGPTGISFYDAPNGNYAPNYKDSACTCIRWPHANDTIVMYWTEFNGYCYGFDSLLIAFTYAPHAEILSISPQNICDTYVQVEAEQPYWGAGYWISNTSGTIFQPNNSQPQVTAYFDTSQTNSFILNWVTVYGPCRDTSNNLIINYDGNPVAFFDTNIVINYLPFQLHISNLSKRYKSNLWEFWNVSNMDYVSSTDTNFSTSIVQYGCYKIKLTVFSSCGSDSMLHTFCVNTIDSYQLQNQLYIYPNPLTNEQNLYIKAPLSFYNITITDIIGNIIFSHFFTQPNSVLNLSHLPSGQYFVKISNRQAAYIRKLTIIR